MSFEVKPMAVKSSDGIHTLSGKIYIPDGEIKGLFHVVHGMTEHIGRYDKLLSAAAHHGFVAFGYDNLGHGKTAADDSELGFIAHKDGWRYLVKDVKVFETAVKELYPDKPLYLMGHSMGSFIVRLAAENYKDSYKRLIICGTGGKNPLAKAGLFLTKTLKLIKGEKYVSQFCLNLAFGTYNKRFSGESEYEWLTNYREVIENYEADKYCAFPFTVSGLCDLIKLNIMCNRKDWYKNISKTMPILLISGDCDPVGDYSKGILQIFNDLKKHKADVSVKLYENCRHEILNDLCGEEVLNKIINFIKEQED